MVSQLNFCGNHQKYNFNLLFLIILLLTDNDNDNFLLSPNQEASSSEQSSDEDDKENKSVRAESVQQGTRTSKSNASVFQGSL